MSQDGDRVTYFAETDYRNQRTPFGIRAEDRAQHMYVIGKTGMGKSTLLENMAIQDIQNGEGMAFVDPHGKTAEMLLQYVPEERIDDVLYFAPFDTECPVSFNVMEDVGYDRRHLVANGLMSAFRKIWVDAWSSRMEYILNNTILALLEYPDSTLLSINRMYTDKEFRKRVVENISDPSVKAFWEDEYAKYTDRYTQEATPAIQNKVGQFTANPIIRNIVGQPRSSFDFRKMMDEQKIVIINLSKGRIGEGNANLLGSMMITKLYLSAMSRADLSESEIKNYPQFFLYVDEFQSFANESFADILSESRKYKLALTIAHQYIEQMTEEVRSAVFGNVGTMAMFRVGAYDAELLEREFQPVFTAEDMVNLGFAQIYLKLMIHGVTSHPFSARTLPPIEPPEQSLRDDVFRRSREQFAAPRAEIERAINEWYHASFQQEERGKEKSADTRTDAGSGDGRPPDRGKNTRGGGKEIKQKGGSSDAEAPPPPKRPRGKGEGGGPAPQKKKQNADAPAAHGTISLDALNSKGQTSETQEKHDKGPKQEHLQELRAALSDALSDGGEEGKDNTQDTSNAEQEGSRDASDTTQKKHEEKQGVNEDAASHTKRNDRRNAERTKDDETHGKGVPPHEIPEDELRNMLKVDE